MILSEIRKNPTKQKGINQTQQILICCDQCQKKYNISFLAQKSCFKKYKKDLCRGCQQKEQIRLGIRGKQYIHAGKSFKEKYEGKTYEEIYGLEKSKSLKKIKSIKSSGKNNPMYGRNDQCYGLKKSTEFQKGKTLEKIYGIEKSNLIKEKISNNSSGKNNPMYGKPAPLGSGNGWSGWYRGWYFRSLRELSFMINVIERFNFQWECGEAKKYQIKYIDFSGEEKNYFPDFILNEKIMVEIKPKKIWNTDVVQRKKEAASVFCKKMGLRYKLSDPIKLLEYNDIKTLLMEGKIQFIDRYKEKFKQWENLYQQRALMQAENLLNAI